MTTVHDLELPDVQIFSPEFEAEPWPIYDAVRRQGWLARCELGFLVVGHKQVSELFRDKRLRPPGMIYTQMLGATDGPWHTMWTNFVINKEGEEHNRLRRLVGASFTPQAADKTRPMMRQIMEDILEVVVPKGACDFMADVCNIYPIRVMCHMIGVAEEDVPSFLRWVETIGRTYDMKPELLPELDEAVAHMFKYVDQVVEARRGSASPPDDLVQSLIEAGDSHDRLTADELRSWLVMLLVAGFDTTANQLGLGMLAFSKHPEQWRMLAADPSLVPQAAEEIMRWIPTIATTPRIASEDLEYEGILIPEGTFILPAVTAAGRDPEAYPDAGNFDITRRGQGHVTFGAGIHYCAGAHIARAELQEALTLLSRRIRDPRMVEEPVWRSPLGIWGLHKLMIEYTAGK